MKNPNIVELMYSAPPPRRPKDDVAVLKAENKELKRTVKTQAARIAELERCIHKIAV